MHRHPYKDLTVEVFDDPTYTLGSADNNNTYSKIYSTDLGRFQPTSKHGVKIFKDREEINNCIVLALGGATGIHPTSSLVDNDQLLICCCDTIFCLSLPDIQLKWKTRTDSATCFQIFKLQADYIVHGEMEITRLDSDGKIKWQYGGADIFVELDGDAFALHADHIEVTDFYKTKYKIDFNGKTISTSRQTPDLDLYITSDESVDFSGSKQLVKINRIRIGLFYFLHATTNEAIVIDKTAHQDFLLQKWYQYAPANYLDKLPIDFMLFVAEKDKNGKIRCGQCQTKYAWLHRKKQ